MLIVCLFVCLFVCVIGCLSVWSISKYIFACLCFSSQFLFVCFICFAICRDPSYFPVRLGLTENTFGVRSGLLCDSIMESAPTTIKASSSNSSHLQASLKPKLQSKYNSKWNRKLLQPSCQKWQINCDTPRQKKKDEHCMLNFFFKNNHDEMRVWNLLCSGAEKTTWDAGTTSTTC